MKEKIITGILASGKEASLVTAGFSAPVWMQMLNAYMGFLIGIFTLIYVIWRVLENIPNMLDYFYSAKQKLYKNWAIRKAEKKDIDKFLKKSKK